MAIDFPNAPSVNDTFTSGGSTWKWDGTTWNAVLNVVTSLTGTANEVQVSASTGNVTVSLGTSISDSKLATISTANKVSLSAIDIDGGTDVGGDLIDSDLIIIDDGGAGTNRKSAITRVPIYTFSKITGNVSVASNGVASLNTLSALSLNGTFTHNSLTHVPSSSGTTAPASPVTGQTWLDTSNSKVRLKVYNGTAWKIVSGDFPRWQIHANTQTTVAANSATAIAFAVEDEDTDGFHTGSDASIVIPAGLGGVYLVSWHMTTDLDTAAAYVRTGWVDIDIASGSSPASATGRRYAQMSIYKDTATASITLSSSQAILANAGQTLRLKIFQNSAVSKSIPLSNRADTNGWSGVMITHLP